MNSYLTSLVFKHQQKGLIIDTNLLILLIVGSCDIKRITKFTRTNIYTEKDFEIIRRFIKPFNNNIVTTPNILTEACNLCLGLNAETDNALYYTFRRIIDYLKEQYIASVKIVSEKEKAFFSFGISDTAIVELCEQGRLLLTDDLELYNYVISQKMHALNFNHIRTMNWLAS